MKLSEKKIFCLSKISKYLIIRIWGVRGDFLQLWHYWIEAYTTGMNILNSHFQGAVFQKWYELYVSNFMHLIYGVHTLISNSQETIIQYTFLVNGYQKVSFGQVRVLGFRDFSFEFCLFGKTFFVEFSFPAPLPHQKLETNLLQTWLFGANLQRLCTEL